MKIFVLPLTSLPVPAELVFPNLTLESLANISKALLCSLALFLFVAIFQRSSLMSSYLSQAGLLMHLLVFPGISCGPYSHGSSQHFQPLELLLCDLSCLRPGQDAHLVPHIWALPFFSLPPLRIFISPSYSP